jgi:transposase-like protein
LWGMRDRLSAEEWAELVEEWETGGQTARAFADAHGVAEASLRWWKKELARRSKRAPPPRRAPTPRPVALARVVRDGEPVPNESASAPATITLVVGRARIVVERGFDASLLRAVLDAVGAPA